MVKTIFATFMLIFAFGTVNTQDTSAWKGIDSLCGPDALELTTAEQTLPDDQAAALDDVLRQFVTLPEAGQPSLSVFSPKPPAPGAVILVITPKGRYFRSMGVADVPTCKPLQPQTPFAMGSNTKMMTAAIIYQLQEEGLLSTNDAVKNYLPDEIALFPRSADATIDQLLAHTAGLPDYLNSKNPASIGGQLVNPDSGVLGKAFTPEELVAAAAAVADDLDQPQFTPGEPGAWQYSNTGYIMLGQIIEQVTGKTYHEVVTERIIKPLGLDHTVMVNDVAPADLGLPSAYLESPFTYDTSGWNFSQAWSAGAAVTTAEDLAAFVKALYSGKLYTDPVTLGQMLTNAAPDYQYSTDTLYYMHGGYFKAGFLGHAGQTLGAESDPGYNPDLDVTIVTWGNASESLLGQGVFHVGHALGLTPSLDEEFTEIALKAQKSAGS